MAALLEAIRLALLNWVAAQQPVQVARTEQRLVTSVAQDTSVMLVPEPHLQLLLELRVLVAWARYILRGHAFHVHR